MYMLYTCSKHTWNTNWQKFAHLFEELRIDAHFLSSLALAIRSLFAAVATCRRRRTVLLLKVLFCAVQSIY